MSAYMKAVANSRNAQLGYVKLLQDSAAKLSDMEEHLREQVALERQRTAQVNEDELVYVRASGPDSGFAIKRELLGQFVKGERISLASPPPFAVGTSQIYYMYMGDYSENGQPDPRTFVESIISDSYGYYSDSFSNELYIPEGQGLWLCNPAPQGITVYVTLQLRRQKPYSHRVSAEEAYALAEGFSSYVLDEDDELEDAPEQAVVRDAETIDDERDAPPQTDERPQPHFAGAVTNLDELPMHGEEDLR